jgi:uncharacterized protein (DUF697 family)
VVRAEERLLRLCEPTAAVREALAKVEAQEEGGNGEGVVEALLAVDSLGEVRQGAGRRGCCVVVWRVGGWRRAVVRPVWWAACSFVRCVHLKERCVVTRPPHHHRPCWRRCA